MSSKNARPVLAAAGLAGDVEEVGEGPLCVAIRQWEHRCRDRVARRRPRAEQLVEGIGVTCHAVAEHDERGRLVEIGQDEADPDGS